MRKSPSLYVNCSFAAILLTIFTNSAHAQDVSDERASVGTNSASRGGAATVDEIVVTARKREERLRDVPVAMSVLDQQLLVQKNITQIVDLTVTVPNLTYSTAVNQPQIFIRGFGSGTNAGFDQSVAKFVDNVYYGKDQDGRIPIFDVERLEVLKGPQVLTFGNSSTAGALNIVTKKPGDTFEADGTAAYEFVDNEVKLQGGVTVPLTEGVSFRLAGFYNRLTKGDVYNGILDRWEPKVRTFAIRPTLVVNPLDGLRITVRGEYDRVQTWGTAFQAVGQPLRPGAPQYPEVDDPARNDYDYSTAPTLSDTKSELRHGMGLLDIAYDVLDGTLTSTTAYRAEKNLINLGNPGANYQQVSFLHALQHYKQFSQELRFNGSYGRFDLDLDAYYEHNDFKINQLNTYTFGGFGVTGVGATPLARIALYDQQYKKYSGAIEGTYRIVDGLSIAAGVRYSRYDKDAQQSLFGANIPPNLGFDSSRAYLYSFRSAALEAGPLQAVTGAQPHAFNDLKRTESHWQPQVIGQYKFGQNMAYVKYASGVKAGGFDFAYASSNPSGIEFGSEKANIFEAGLKGQAFGRLLDYSVAVYQQTFQGLQFSSLVGTSFRVNNVGKARSRGVEIETTWRPVYGLRIGLTGAYTDPKYLDYRNASCTTGQIVVTPSGCTQDLTGHMLQYTSKWTGNASIDYDRDVGDYNIGGGVSVFGRTKFSVSAVDDPRGYQKGFAQLDVHLDLKPVDGKWTASLFGRNLTNVRYLNYVGAPPGNNTSLVSGFERGKQIGLQFGFRY